MKTLKKTLVRVVLTIALLTGLLYAFQLDYLLKAVGVIYLQGHTTAFLEDYKHFDNRNLEPSTQPVAWPVHKKYNSVSATDDLRKAHSDYGTTAFLIIRNDSIWHEDYPNGSSKEALSNSFSMAKTVVSAMLGKAISRGEIKGLDQPVSDFFPEISGPYAAELTVGDLSSMASGLNWDESYYSPFSVTTRAYFEDDLRSLILGLQVTEQPGKSYRYLSGSTQLLGMVLEKATGKTLTAYLQEHFWEPMGFESEALWQLDSEESGIEKAYCCLAATARDFARFGKLYKDKGQWLGKTILPEDFVTLSTHQRFPESPEYGYGLWLLQHKNKDFFMLRGHLGQYVIVQPEDNLIIVRLGHQKAISTDGEAFSSDILTYIDQSYQMTGNAL